MKVENTLRTAEATPLKTHSGISEGGSSGPGRDHESRGPGCLDVTRKYITHIQHGIEDSTSENSCSPGGSSCNCKIIQPLRAVALQSQTDKLSQKTQNHQCLMGVSILLTTEHSLRVCEVGWY